ncbi:thymidylate kinase [Abalone shriveling syndrome-associated virus]|uniref:thymidylate kinase n=1 Tax=Abalone shriveling syndrome-associated virus TaxID=491893 RepID=UPI0001881BA5|nr:thymidylate kinase [Abalone shriveling syndrome-associated virus]ACJ71974.1 thymidylate kinase [Abalone shriveling syndrome-associated virus]
MFITIEGIDKIGKSTVAQGLQRKFSQYSDNSIVLTHEPFNFNGLSNFLKKYQLSSKVEILIQTAARIEHATRLINPAISSGSIVICDRFIDSTIVYQGICCCDGISDLAAKHELNNILTGFVFCDNARYLLGQALSHLLNEHYDEHVFSSSEHMNSIDSSLFTDDLVNDIINLHQKYVPCYPHVTILLQPDDENVFLSEESNEKYLDRYEEIPFSHKKNIIAGYKHIFCNELGLHGRFLGNRRRFSRFFRTGTESVAHMVDDIFNFLTYS